MTLFEQCFNEVSSNNKVSPSRTEHWHNNNNNNNNNNNDYDNRNHNTICVNKNSSYNHKLGHLAKVLKQSVITYLQLKLWDIRLLCLSQSKCQYKPVTLNKLNCSWFCHITSILLTELCLSIWENPDLGRVYRPHCIRFVFTTSVKILLYRLCSVNITLKLAEPKLIDRDAHSNIC